MLPKDWFTARIGQVISRTIPGDKPRDVTIHDQHWAEYLFKNQDNKHTYAEH